jgi:hypothetical protein
MPAEEMAAKYAGAKGGWAQKDGEPLADYKARIDIRLANGDRMRRASADSRRATADGRAASRDASRAASRASSPSPQQPRGGEPEASQRTANQQQRLSADDDGTSSPTQELAATAPLATQPCQPRQQ